MTRTKSSYAKKLDYNNAYNREKYRSFSMRFNLESEKDIIEWLQSKNGVKPYLEGLIRKDMAARKEDAPEAKKKDKEKDKDKEKSEDKKKKKRKRIRTESSPNPIPLTGTACPFYLRGVYSIAIYFFSGISFLSSFAGNSIVSTPSL